MRRLGIMLAGMALVGATFSGVSLAAASAATPQADAAARPTGISSLSADGYFYAFDRANFDRGGHWCRWAGNDDWWATTPYGDCNDQATSVWNNGYTAVYDDVRMWRDIRYTGPTMCLGRGDYWGNLALGIEHFNTGENANNKISSHRWVTGC